VKLAAGAKAAAFFDSRSAGMLSRRYDLEYRARNSEVRAFSLAALQEYRIADPWGHPPHTPADDKPVDDFDGDDDNDEVDKGGAEPEGIRYYVKVTPPKDRLTTTPGWAWEMFMHRGDSYLDEIARPAGPTTAPVYCGSGGISCVCGALPPGLTPELIHEGLKQRVGGTALPTRVFSQLMNREVAIVYSPSFPKGFSQPVVLGPMGGAVRVPGDVQLVMHTHTDPSVPQTFSSLDVYGDPAAGIPPPQWPVGVALPNGETLVHMPSEGYITPVPPDDTPDE